MKAPKEEGSVNCLYMDVGLIIKPNSRVRKERGREIKGRGEKKEGEKEKCLVVKYMREEKMCMLFL